jgi:hypothetical protein
MLSTIATKVALKKVGLSSNALDFNLPSFSSSSYNDDRPPPRQPNKLRKAPPSPRPQGDDDDEDGGSWSSWLSLKSLPLTAQPWLAPPPPPIEVAAVPGIGDAAPSDRDGKLQLGRGRKTLVVFLRCVGCACEYPFPPHTPPTTTETYMHRKTEDPKRIVSISIAKLTSSRSSYSCPKDIPQPPHPSKPLPQPDPLRRRLPLLPAGHPEMDRHAGRRLGRRGGH